MSYQQSSHGTLGHRQHRRRLLRRTAALPPLILSLAAVANVTAAARLAAAPSLLKTEKRVAAATAKGWGRPHGLCLGKSSPGGVAARVRGGSRDEEDEDVNEELSSRVGEVSSLTSMVKEILSKLLEVIGSWLGNSSSSNCDAGGGDGGGTKAWVRRTKPGKSKRGATSKTGGGGFKKAFEAKYGKSHPRFTEKPFADATEHAWARNRLCLVYIPAERGSGSKAVKADGVICKALADSEVAMFVDSNFVMWVPGGKSAAQRSAAAAAATRRLSVRSLPFLGVVNSASVTDKVFLERKLKRSTVGLHHCNPPPSSGQMISWMSRVQDLNKGLLETERAVQQKLKDEEAIHVERVQGYSESLKDDALRELREREEEAERARLEEEENRAREAREANERADVERRESKALELGQEPTPESGMVIATLMLRLTDGSRVRRRFLRSDTMGKVLDWADVQGVDLEAQRLSSSFPKASFSYPQDAAMTIEEAGLGKQALLAVEQKPSVASKSGTGNEAPEL